MQYKFNVTCRKFVIVEIVNKYTSGNEILLELTLDYDHLENIIDDAAIAARELKIGKDNAK